MSDWDEIRRLAADFQRAQSGSQGVRESGSQVVHSQVVRVSGSQVVHSQVVTYSRSRVVT